MIRELRYRVEFRFWLTVNWLAGKLGYIPTETYVLMNDEWRDLCGHLTSRLRASQSVKPDQGAVLGSGPYSPFNFPVDENLNRAFRDSVKHILGRREQ